MIAGINIIAPNRHVLIDTITRAPKKRNEVKPENNKTENPAITLNAFMIILLPMIFIEVLVESS